MDPYSLPTEYDDDLALLGYYSKSEQSDLIAHWMLEMNNTPTNAAMS